MEKQNSPAWFYGPNGAAKIFDNPEDVPAGWQDHPSKVGAAAVPLEKTPPTNSQPTPTTPDTETVQIDAHGWPWTAELHAASKSMTNAGLWRMKVGASRPAPKEGYPKSTAADIGAPPLDL
ncbi:MAG: hypothetical protein C0510_12995 [Erythrobacter sp.]|nr:hypothetical protein [Erythrobacter sp.]